MGSCDAAGIILYTARQRTHSHASDNNCLVVIIIKWQTVLLSSLFFCTAAAYNIIIIVWHRFSRDYSSRYDAVVVEFFNSADTQAYMRVQE